MLASDPRRCHHCGDLWPCKDAPRRAERDEERAAVVAYLRVLGDEAEAARRFAAAAWLMDACDAIEAGDHLK